MKSGINRLLLNSYDGICEWAIEKGSEIYSALAASDEIGKGLVENINFLYRKVLKESSLSITDIGEIVFIHGPGSFTSLRTSYAFIMGLSAGHGIPVFALSAFLVTYLNSFKDLCEKANICIKANSSEYFICEFNKTNLGFTAGPGRITSITEPIDCFFEIKNKLVMVDIVKARNLVSQFDVNTLQSIRESNHLYDEKKTGICELMYIKGVSAKTLKERGIWS